MAFANERHLPRERCLSTSIFTRLFVLFAHVEKRRKERETIGQPNRLDARRRKEMRYQILSYQYLFRD